MTLGWYEARAEDREELSKFICADPERRQYDRHRGRYHPEPWTFEVQSYIRNLRPPVGPTEILEIFRDEEGIAAVAHFGFDGEAEQFLVWAVARARRCRGRGLGGITLEMAIGILRQLRRSQDIDCGAFTWVHPKNHLSKAMLRDAGFEFLLVEAGYEGWAHDLSI